MATNSQDIKNNVDRNKILKARTESRGLAYSDDVSHFAITIGRPHEEVFAFWRDFQNLPTFMKDLKEIQILSPKKSHWKIELESGLKAEWDAEITAERTNEMISWKSVEGADVETNGTVWFRKAPQGLGTVVSLVLDYSVPGGKLTEWLTKLGGEDPDTLTFTNLRRLKCYLETGEIATTTGQSSGRDEDLETPTKH